VTVKKLGTDLPLAQLFHPKTNHRSNQIAIFIFTSWIRESNGGFSVVFASSFNDFEKDAEFYGLAACHRWMSFWIVSRSFYGSFEIGTMTYQTNEP
jgi:hypothetical protein